MLKQCIIGWYCGIKSDIPFCCIIFYCLFWSLLTPRDSAKFSKFLWHYRDMCPTNYIMCPFCLIRKKAKMAKKCKYNRCHIGFCSLSGG